MATCDHFKRFCWCSISENVWPTAWLWKSAWKVPPSRSDTRTSRWPVPFQSGAPGLLENMENQDPLGPLGPLAPAWGGSWSSRVPLYLGRFGTNMYKTLTSLALKGHHSFKKSLEGYLRLLDALISDLPSENQSCVASQWFSGPLQKSLGWSPKLIQWKRLAKKSEACGHQVQSGFELGQMQNNFLNLAI